MMTFILFILVFSVIVISHEFGHFIVAKSNGIHVVEFFVGMGPTIFSFTKKGTKYSLKLLPLGGACVFEGEDGTQMLQNRKDEEADGEEKVKPGSMFDKARVEISDEPVKKVTAEDIVAEHKKGGKFNEAGIWGRIATVLAGPFFNFILAFIVSVIMVSSGSYGVRDSVIDEITEGGAAAEAGLMVGDRVFSANGEKIKIFEELQVFFQLNEGQAALLGVERGNERFYVTITPQYSEEYGRYLIGISNATYLEPQGVKLFKYSWYMMRYYVKLTYKSLGAMLRGNFSRQDVAGPVGVAVNVVGKTYESTKSYGALAVIMSMMNIILMLSVNLGIINLLPLPALDGGRLVFLLIELVRGKPVPPEKEGMVHFAGVVLLLILMVFVFFNDLVNIFA